MPSCQECGFEIPDPENCPVCAASRRNAVSADAPAPARFAAAFFRLVLPALLAPSLIAAAAALYLAYPFGLDLPELDPPSAPQSTALPSPRAAEPSSAPAELPVSAPRGATGLEWSAAGAAGKGLPRLSEQMPTKPKKAYIEWMLAHGTETRPFLERKWDRAQALLANKDITSQSLLSAFLYTPREYFVRKFNLKKAYDNTAIPIGYGQTISGPHMVVNMTQSIAPRRDDRILEIGTGSGYQSALLSELSDNVYTIEIVAPLQRETDRIYRSLAARYPEYGSIARQNADGYFGWNKYAPFQKIIVTAGIDHIPPPLLRQLAPNGVMVIPVGPPTGQTVLRIVKRPVPGGGFAFERSDIYHGSKVIFVPFTASGGSRHSLDDSTVGAGR
jgi:protein-L-isoaspartate(D-aspartate) O-methyltransferase